jgi:hypothetical protein
MSRTAVALRGAWRVTVVHKRSHWPQRVVSEGAENPVLPGVVGASVTMSGDDWQLAVDHDAGGGWQRSEYVQAVGTGDGLLIVSKDRYWAGDSQPDDLVLRLNHVGRLFEVMGAPEVDSSSLSVTVRNTSYRAFGYDLVLDVTDAGRAALAAAGVELDDTGFPAEGQTLPPLEVGEQCVIRLPVSSVTGSGQGVDVEFVVARAGRTGGERQTVRMGGPALVKAAERLPGGAITAPGGLVEVFARTRTPEYSPAPASAPATAATRHAEAQAPG